MRLEGNQTLSQSGDSPRNINTAKPFVRAYEAYQERGWLGVMPLPAGQKHPPPVGWTGRNARHPEQDDIDEWLMKVKYKNANIGLHLGITPDGEHEVVGIDVDNYGDKAGADQLQRLEREHGKLPATWISSSRMLPSGIKFYRVPKGYAFIGKASSAIDIIQRAHRYAVVWPSWNPDSDAQYAWWSPDGRRVESLDELPNVVELPLLSPEDPDTHSWFKFLTRDGMQDTGEEIDMDMSVNEVFAWATGNFRKANDDEDNVCSKMQGAVDYWLNSIEEDESSHDKITGAHWNIMAMGSEGHYDWSVATEAIERAYIKNTLSRGKRSLEDLKGEVGRSKINALRKIKAQIESGKRALSTACSCYTPTEEDLALVAAALKAQSAKGKGASPGKQSADHSLATNATQRERVRSGLDDEPDAGDAGGTGTFKDGMPYGVPADPGEYSMDDDGNAQHWRDIFKTHAYYIPEYDDWIMWNGMEWIKGEGMARRSYGAVKQRQASYAKQLGNVARSLAEADDPRAKSAVALARRWSSWADRSGMSGPKDAALKTASDHLILHERELNKDPDVFGVANGVLRLNRDGSVTLNDLRKDDFITLNTGTPYVPWSELGADYEDDATTWEDAVETWLPDEELRLYVQKLLGYSMLGDNRDRICVFLLGTTGTGKSTFLNTIMAALGDYAGPVDLSIFRGDRHTNPALVYALPQRIITASEASQRNILHADVFKRITGGEPISAELKYANEIIKRVPAFVPWVATNAAPSMPGADVAVKRRVRVVPFNAQVTEDATLGVRMRSSKGIATAALSWCIEGWQMYVAEGLSANGLPTAMVDASKTFNSDMSDFGQFVAERIVVSEAHGAAGKVWEAAWSPTVGEVYDDYLAWCADNRTPDRNVLQRNWFGRQMNDNGFQSRLLRANGETARRFEGIRLRYSRTTKLESGG